MGKLKHRYTGVEFEVVSDDVRVKHRDFFSMKNFYIMMHEWFVQEGWAPRSDIEFPEALYLHRWTQTSGQELWIWWRFEKKPHGTTYYRWDLDIDWHIIGLKEESIMHDGKKYKANFGEPEIKTYAKIVVDQKGMWKKHWFLKHVTDIFMRRIYRREILMHRRELYRDLYRLMESIKTYNKLRTYLPEPELSFHPDKEFK